MVVSLLVASGMLEMLFRELLVVSVMVQGSLNLEKKVYSFPVFLFMIEMLLI